MDAVKHAMERAAGGLGWSYPCLIWVADYLLEATGIDYALGWRNRDWNEATATLALARLAAGGQGATSVEKALDNMARAQGWEPVTENRQGAVMIGVFNGIGPDGEGVPAIFDGESRWIAGHVEGRRIESIGLFPDRAWELSA